MVNFSPIDEKLRALAALIRNHCWIYLIFNRSNVNILKKYEGLDGIVLGEKEYFADKIILEQSKIYETCSEKIMSYLNGHIYSSAISFIVFAVGTERHIFEKGFLPDLLEKNREKFKRFSYMSSSKVDLCQVSTGREEDNLHCFSKMNEIYKSLEKGKKFNEDKILTLEFMNKKLLRIIEVTETSEVIPMLCELKLGRKPLIQNAKILKLIEVNYLNFFLNCVLA